jgi:DNA-binding response OmpR family regulator
MNDRPLILLVEDSPTQALEIQSHLQDYGFTVLVAEDGVSGLRCVDEHGPDLVVLDVNLPKMDGFQVCRRLKRDPQTARIPVIMLTVADSSESTITGLEAGADDYIPKDIFAVDNLISTMQSLGIEIGEA